MTRAPVLWVGIASLAIGAGLAWWFKPMTAEQPPPLATIESMGHIVSVRVNYSDVIDFTLPRAVDIPGTPYEIRYGGTTVLLIAKGDCSLATDLRLAKYESVDAKGRRLTVVLPSPTVMGARVNHSAPEKGGSRLYGVTNNGLEAFIPDTSNRNQAIEDAYRTAETRVTAACRNTETMRQAKANTETLLSGMYRSTGWAASFEWRERRAPQSAGM